MRRGVKGVKPRKPALGHGKGGGKYWLAVLLVAVVLFWAQARWFDRAKRAGAARFDSPVAEKIAEKMRAIKGLPEEKPADGAAAAAAPAAATGPGILREDVIPCETCAGTGKAGDGSFCPLCFGHGARFLRRIEGRERLCPACGGMGRVPGGDAPAELCPRCSGRGIE